MPSPPQPGRPIACIVLPTYNERNNLSTVLPRIFEQAARIPTHALHVLVVDDNSPDGTADLVREAMPANPNLHLLTGEKRGIGDAYKRGMTYAVEHLGAALLLEMDADGQHDPTLLPDFIRLASERLPAEKLSVGRSSAERASPGGACRLVIGSRFLPESAMPEFGPGRRALSHTGSFLVRLCCGIGPVGDCTSGYRAFPAELFCRCDFRRLPTRGYSFQTAILCELVRHGAKVVEIPMVFAPRLDGESKLKLRDCVEFLFTLAGLTMRRFITPSPSPATAPVEVPAESAPRKLAG